MIRALLQAMRRRRARGRACFDHAQGERTPVGAAPLPAKPMASGGLVPAGTPAPQLLRAELTNADIRPPLPGEWILSRFESCPHCGSTTFGRGPRAGMSENLYCAHCGAGFNVVHLPSGGLYLDREIRPPVQPIPARAV